MALPAPWIDEDQTVLTRDPAHYSLRACENCNAVYESGLTATLSYCPKCLPIFERMNEECGHIGVRSDRVQGPVKWWTILRDPSGDCGGRFDSQSFLFTLNFGYWPDGLVAEYGGRLYTVSGSTLVRDDGIRWYANYSAKLCEVAE
jgi:hypothetical protein